MKKKSYFFSVFSNFSIFLLFITPSVWATGDANDDTAEELVLDELPSDSIMSVATPTDSGVIPTLQSDSQIVTQGPSSLPPISTERSPTDSGIILSVREQTGSEPTPLPVPLVTENSNSAPTLLERRIIPFQLSRHKTDPKNNPPPLPTNANTGRFFETPNLHRVSDPVSPRAVVPPPLPRSGRGDFTVQLDAQVERGIWDIVRLLTQVRETIYLESPALTPSQRRIAKRMMTILKKQLLWTLSTSDSGHELSSDNPRIANFFKFLDSGLIQTPTGFHAARLEEIQRRRTGEIARNPFPGAFAPYLILMKTFFEALAVNARVVMGYDPMTHTASLQALREARPLVYGENLPHTSLARAWILESNQAGVTEFSASDVVLVQRRFLNAMRRIINNFGDPLSRPTLYSSPRPSSNPNDNVRHLIADDIDELVENLAGLSKELKILSAPASSESAQSRPATMDELRALAPADQIRFGIAKVIHLFDFLFSSSSSTNHAFAHMTLFLLRDVLTKIDSLMDAQTKPVVKDLFDPVFQFAFTGSDASPARIVLNPGAFWFQVKQRLRDFSDRLQEIPSTSLAGSLNVMTDIIENLASGSRTVADFDRISNDAMLFPISHAGNVFELTPKGEIESLLALRTFYILLQDRFDGLVIQSTTAQTSETSSRLSSSLARLEAAFSEHGYDFASRHEVVCGHMLSRDAIELDGTEVEFMPPSRSSKN